MRCPPSASSSSATSTARALACAEFAAGLDRIPLDAEWLPTLAQLAELAVALGDRTSAAVLDAAMAPFDDRIVVEGIGAAVCGTLGAYRARSRCCWAAPNKVASWPRPQRPRPSGSASSGGRN